MSIIAPIDSDGNLVQDLASTSTSTEKKTSNSSLGKDDFLQLLVAQMQYQDPLEPTSNTEYISQYATFSELEQMQNVSASVNLDRATNLVGKHVYMKPTNATTGVTSYVYGKVDSVKVENGKAFLIIDGNSYSIDDLDSVVDEAYKDAYDKAQTLFNDILELPTLANVTMEDEEAITKIVDTYDKMSDYEKSFFSEDVKKSIDNYKARLDEVKKVAEEAAKTVIEDFSKALNELPKVEELTLENETAVNSVNEKYNDMTKFQKSYVTEEDKTLLDSYVAKMEELKKAGEA